MDIIDLEAKAIGFIAPKVESVDVSTITTASKFEELGFDSLDIV